MKYFFLLIFLFCGSTWADSNDVHFQNEVYNNLMNFHQSLKKETHDSEVEDLELNQIRLRLKPFASFNIEGLADVRAAAQIEFYIER